MLATESRLLKEEKFILSPPVKKIRTDSASTNDSSLAIDPTATVRNLELEGVKELFQDYDLQETEAVSCVICGKNYKSKVCVKKHLWEHSVYWDLFDGLKKQQRVLSIQAAIILAIKFNPSLSLLLVTNSSSGQRRKSSERQQNEKSPTVIVSETSTASSLNRKRKYDNVATATTTTKDTTVDSHRNSDNICNDTQIFKF